ncbi:MAG: SDR family oxidoreductase [Acidobacteriota bacterium]
MRFNDRTVLVTGGSGGIGRETCRRFAAEGARVFVHYGTREDEADTTLGLLGGGAPHAKVQADLQEADAIVAMVDHVVDTAGRIDILVNNAGIFERHPPATTEVDAWRHAWGRTLGINLLGPAHASHRAAHHMIERGEGGTIVNVSSRGAFRGEPECPAYGASKAGLNALSQSLAVALGSHGIHVFAVAPGFVETAMARPWLTGDQRTAMEQQSPLGRVAEVGDVAHWILALADPASAFATGAIVDVNGASYLRT